MALFANRFKRDIDVFRRAPGVACGLPLGEGLRDGLLLILRLVGDEWLQVVCRDGDGPD